MNIINSFGELPHYFYFTLFSSISEKITDGTHATPTYVEYGIPFYSVENVVANNFSKVKYISPKLHETLCKRIEPQKGDILLTRIGAITKTKLIDWDVNASIYVSLALIRLSNNVCKEYIYQYTKSDFFRQEVEKRALLNATPMKINLGEIGKIPVPIPKSIKEQIKIAEILSALDKKIDLIAQEITQTEQLKIGLLQKLFSEEVSVGSKNSNWQFSTLESIANVTMGSSPSSTSYNDDKKGLPLVQGNADIKNRVTKPRVYTTQITKECQVNDIIMTVRAPVGAIAKSNQNSCIGRGVCAIQPTGINSDYLYQYLIAQENSWNVLEQGSTFSAVNSKEVKQLEIKFHSDIDEQRKVSELLSSIDEKFELLKLQKNETQQLKKGLMQKLFTGEWRVPLNDNEAA